MTKKKSKYQKKELQAFFLAYSAIVEKKIKYYQHFFKEFESVQSSSFIIKPKDVNAFFFAYDDARQKYIARESKELNSLNVFDVLNFTYDEFRHSKVLGWLLDKKAGHYQGSNFFSIFCKRMSLPKTYAKEDYVVNLEVQGESSRIDIEIIAKGRFVIFIENKIQASLGEKQLERESEDLNRTRIVHGIPKSKQHFFFLTPNKDNPLVNVDYKPVGWMEIRDCVQEFTETTIPMKLQWFLLQYSDTIYRHIIRNT